MLHVENLDAYYGDMQALDAVSLDVDEGAIVAIVGANGAGKTTLIRALAGMNRPARGQILFRGADIAGWPSYRVCNLGIGQVSAACCRGPAPLAGETGIAFSRFFRCWPNAHGRPPVRSRAASSRCLRSAAV
jgi:ABC-type Na+ transport system ATPase subunit NatA